MSTEAVSEILTGITSGLLATYSSGSTNSTALVLTKQYHSFVVYVTTGAQVSSGTVKVYCDGSPDGTTAYIDQTFNSSLTQSDMFYTLATASTNYRLVFDNVGTYSRIRIAYGSGTSIVISAVTIEAKS